LTQVSKSNSSGEDCHVIRQQDGKSEPKKVLILYEANTFFKLANSIFLSNFFPTWIWNLVLVQKNKMLQKKKYEQKKF